MKRENYRQVVHGRMFDGRREDGLSGENDGRFPHLVASAPHHYDLTSSELPTTLHQTTNNFEAST